MERAEKIGKKILISGGGRCNFTKSLLHAGEFHFGKSAFCEIGFGAIHANGFYFPGGKAPHFLSRKDARAAFLRSRRE